MRSSLRCKCLSSLNTPKIKKRNKGGGELNHTHSLPKIFLQSCFFLIQFSFTDKIIQYTIHSLINKILFKLGNSQMLFRKIFKDRVAFSLHYTSFFFLFFLKFFFLLSLHNKMVSFFQYLSYLIFSGKLFFLFYKVIFA